MKKSRVRILAAVLCVVMILGTTNAFAVTPGENDYGIMPMAETDRFSGDTVGVRISCTIEYRIQNGKTFILSVSDIDAYVIPNVMNWNVFVLNSSSYTLLDGGQSVKVTVVGKMTYTDFDGLPIGFPQDAAFSYTFTP